MSGRILVAGLALALLAGPSFGQACPGQSETLRVSEFDQVHRLALVYPTFRGEFESTEQFVARQTSAATALAEAVWVRLPLDLTYVRYDADSQAFQVQNYALDNRNLDYGYIFGSAGLTIPTGRESIDLVLPSEVEAVSSYVGKNIYGATRDITQVSSATRAIFERRARRNENLFPGPATQPAFSVAVPVAQAPQLRDRLKAAVLIQPLPPFHAEGSGQTRVTMTGGRDETVAYQVLVADIRCIAITDDNDVVLQSRATN